MRVQANLVVQNKVKISGKKILKNILNKFKPVATTVAVPVVATPILAYFSPKKNAQLRTAKAVEEEVKARKYNSSNTPVKDDTIKNEKALEKAGVRRSERAKYIDSDGEMTEEGKRICKAKGVTNFKGAPENSETMFNNDGVDDFSAVAGPLSDKELASLGADMPEFNFAEFEELSYADIAEVLNDPALHAFAAEILPGTRFLQPLKDLKKGDYEKAGVGVASRTVEIALAPVKLGWVACGSLMGSAFRLCGVDEDWTGPIGGAKHFSMEWAKGRDAIENEILGKETKEPELTPDQVYAQYKDSKEKAIKNLQEKIATRGEETRKQLSEYYANELLKFSSYNEYLQKLIDKEEERQDFYIEQITNIISTGQADTEAIDKDLKNVLAKKAELKKAYDEQLKQLDEYLQTNLSDEKIAQKIEQRKLELEKIFNSSNEFYNAEIDRINNILKVNEILQQNKNNKGLAKVAGYEGIKDALYTSFIKPLKQNDTENIPNLILLYGPKGCGKTFITKSLAEEVDTNHIKLRLTLNSDKDMENLRNAIKKSVEDYENTKKHTIIHIDEINGFLKNKQDLDFISSLAKDKHCTIVGTTNEPEKINKHLIPKEGFESIYVEPADKRNIMKVSRYYLKNIADVKFDYSKVAEILENNSNGDFYSNARIENFVKSYIKTEFLNSNRFDSNVFLEKLQELKPDIKAESIQKFGKDIK